MTLVAAPLVRRLRPPLTGSHRPLSSAVRRRPPSVSPLAATTPLIIIRTRLFVVAAVKIGPLAIAAESSSPSACVIQTANEAISPVIAVIEGRPSLRNTHGL